MKVVCENLDRLITVESRLPSIPRGFTSKLYDATRADGEPLSYQIANQIKNIIEENEILNIGIFTGVWNPQWLPNGENDGPIGAVVLGNSLEMAGAKVTFYVEKELIPVMKRMCESLNVSGRILGLSRESEKENALIADSIGLAIFIEKIGPSAKGIYQFATGLARNNQDAPLGLLLSKLKESEKLTIGIGDMGNEIGFGKIYNTVRTNHPFGINCLCDEKDGFGTVLETDYLLPAGVSNIGAYGIVAALALLMNNTQILHTPEDEKKLIKICTEMDCRDGGFGKTHNYVDGISIESMASFVRILKEIVESYFTEEKRAF